MYRVSKYMDSIKRVEKNIDINVWNRVADLAFYEYFETFEEAKQYCINRAKREIEKAEKEIKRLKKKLPKLEAITEQMLNSDKNVQGSDTTEADSGNSVK